jgi:glycine cleavage system H protein
MSESYLPTHEWARQEGELIVIGLSSFAAGEIGDVIHIELPKLGATLSQGTPCAEIESVKSVNDYYSPVTGTVVAINESLRNSPEQINSDPLGAGWFAKVRASGPTPLGGLLSAAAYQARLAT